MRVLPFLVSIFLILISSCDKTYHTTVQGKVINACSREPIDSVLVEMRDGVGAGGGWADFGGGSTSSDKNTSTYTNAKGEFTISLSGEYNAVVSLSKKGYTFETLEGGIQGYGDGYFANQVLLLRAYAYFDPVLKSRDLSFADDELILSMLSQQYPINGEISGRKNEETGSNYTFIGNGPFKYNSSFKDYLYLSTGDIYQPFKLTLRRNGNVITRIDSVFIKSLATYRDTIYY